MRARGEPLQDLTMIYKDLFQEALKKIMVRKLLD